MSKRSSQPAELIDSKRQRGGQEYVEALMEFARTTGEPVRLPDGRWFVPNRGRP